MRLPEISIGNASLRCQKGFTLVELIVVSAISVILVAGAVPLYSNLQTFSQVGETSSQLIQTLRTAQSQSRARVNGAAHGVAIVQSASADSLVLFQGASYATRNTAFDRETVLASSMNLITTLPSNEVVFVAGTGTPSVTGTITLIHEVNGQRIVSINDVGRIE